MLYSPSRTRTCERVEMRGGMEHQRANRYAFRINICSIHPDTLLWIHQSSSFCYSYVTICTFSFHSLYFLLTIIQYCWLYFFSIFISIRWNCNLLLFFWYSLFRDDFPWEILNFEINGNIFLFIIIILFLYWIFFL